MTFSVSKDIFWVLKKKKKTIKKAWYEPDKIFLVGIGILTRLEPSCSQSLWIVQMQKNKKNINQYTTQGERTITPQLRWSMFDWWFTEITISMVPARPVKCTSCQANHAYPVLGRSDNWCISWRDKSKFSQSHYHRQLIAPISVGHSFTSEGKTAIFPR